MDAPTTSLEQHESGIHAVWLMRAAPYGLVRAAPE
jgi:hypothetical protein